jgi:hypothetical protein
MKMTGGHITENYSKEGRKRFWKKFEIRNLKFEIGVKYEKNRKNN